MVKFALKISCDVENINEISTSPNFNWNLKFKCIGCHEEDSNWHAVSDADEAETETGLGNFNFTMKCKFCSKPGSLEVISSTIKPVKVENDRVPKQTCAVFDCRGIEPIAFDPQGGWIVKCDETGSKFNDVEIGEDGSWAGYDEKGKFPVTIDDFKWEFARV